MAKPRQLFYWDSDVLLAYLSKEPARFTTLQTIVADIEGSDDRKKIVTSEIAKVEVAFAAYERTTRTLDAKFERDLDDFWADDSVVELVEFHDQIAKQARTFIRELMAMGGKALKPYDAIHLAPAQWVGVYEFHTYNLDDFDRVAPLVKFKICEPYASQPRLIGDDSGYL
jgi:predicted nucleic acid-binding protein